MKRIPAGDQFSLHFNHSQFIRKKKKATNEGHAAKKLRNDGKKTQRDRGNEE